MHRKREIGSRGSPKRSNSSTRTLLYSLYLQGAFTRHSPDTLLYQLIELITDKNFPDKRPVYSHHSVINYERIKESFKQLEKTKPTEACTIYSTDLVKVVCSLFNEKVEAFKKSAKIRSLYDLQQVREIYMYNHTLDDNYSGRAMLTTNGSQLVKPCESFTTKYLDANFSYKLNIYTSYCSFNIEWYFHCWEHHPRTDVRNI